MRTRPPPRNPARRAIAIALSGHRDPRQDRLKEAVRKSETDQYVIAVGRVMVRGRHEREGSLSSCQTVAFQLPQRQISMRREIRMSARRPFSLDHVDHDLPGLAHVTGPRDESATREVPHRASSR